MGFEKHTELQLLEAIEDEPETSQADLAARAGVAVGTVNWYLKRWSTKGLIKVKRIGRWRWRYLLTPQGITEKAHLAASYVEWSMTLYRMTRSQAQQILSEVREVGYDSVRIDGQGDIADICRLTCLEFGLREDTDPDDKVPVLSVNGRKMTISWPEPMSEINHLK
jgi:DNA-binding MarR family transcriptional regulator